VTRKDALSRLRAQIDAGSPIIGAGAGTGLSAKCAEAGGADLIIIYNSGRYRMGGRGSLSGLMPYGDANAIVVDIDPENRGKNLIKIINPEIVESHGEIVMEEGCLSVINFTAEIGRARKILVRGWTPDQKPVELEAEELAAVCIQHEMDHLEGKLLTDHISRLKRELYRKRLKRIEFPVHEKPRSYGETHFRALPSGSRILRYLVQELGRPA